MFKICVRVLAAAGAFAALPTCANELSSVLFSSFEANHRSAFISMGGKLAYPIGPETKGFVLASAGLSLSDLRRAREGKLTSKAIAAEARLLIGLEHSHGQLYTGLAIGPSINAFQRHDGTARQRSGIAAQADIWYRPTNKTAIHVTALVDSGAHSLWARMRYGYAYGGLPLLIGPEAAFATSVTTRKLQVGLHATEWKLGRFVLGISGGWQWDQKKAGPYLSAAAYVPY